MKICAITACPSGVAHTYMSAEALKKAAAARGHQIKVETQGQIGIENVITQEEANQADVVIFTTDVALKDTDRFKGKPTVRVTVGEAVKKAVSIIEKIEVALKNRS